MFETLGAKANLTTAGNPTTFDQVNQHVASYLSSLGSNYASWIQIGWDTGQFLRCSGETTTGTSIKVYVEIYDDSSAPCFASLYGNAPSNASYDARYYGQASGYYEYRAYYQAPGSSTIQYLAYGDFNQQYTAQVASTEVLARTVGGQTPSCPVMGDTLSGRWNLLGNPNSDTFAGYLSVQS